jgi:hypothetical protein
VGTPTHWRTETRVPGLVERAVGIIAKGLAGQPSDEQIRADLKAFAEYIGILARADELQRVKAATLDAETDVWSLTDEGQITSLNDRIEKLNEL